MPPSRFAIGTFEVFKAHPARRPYGEGVPSGTAFAIHDPFGLRRAIVPVFQRNPDGSTFGVGTAFHVDGWGGLLTADHVVDSTRTRHLREVKPNALIQVDIAQSPHASVLLSYGVIFGTVVIPERCWAPIGRVDAIAERYHDPMAELRGDLPYRIGVDLAGMKAVLHPEAPAFHTLPVDFCWQPQLGETVFAVGYPELGFKAMHEGELEDYLTEGMFSVYGEITNIFPHGRDKTHPTPVFEVEADWQSGMSGGPIFNQQGNVVGVVSYSLPPSEMAPGVGYATCFSYVPDARDLVPMLNADNPGHRFGFGVYNPTSWHLAAVRLTPEEAEQARIELGSGYVIAWVSHRLGSGDFMLCE